MDINNCKLSTGYDYANGDNDESAPCGSKRRFHLEIKIPIPGGDAIYKIPTTESINKNIEVASALLDQMKRN